MITFNIFRIVGGIGVGLCSIASPMYTNEIAPARWRGGLGFMYQLAIVVGSIVAALVGLAAGADGLRPQMSWRWMFASELIFVAIFGGLAASRARKPALAGRARPRGRGAADLRADRRPEFADAEMAADRAVAGRRDRARWRSCLRRGCGWRLLVGLCLALFNNYTGLERDGRLPDATLFEIGGLPRDRRHLPTTCWPRVSWA